MSRAPRKTKPRPRPDADANERDLRELALFLEEAPGFRLGLATVDNVQTRQTQLDRLEGIIASRPVFLTRLDLGKFPDEEQLLQRLQDHLRDHPAPDGETPAVMVVGLEAHLNYRDLGEGRIPPQPILRNANIQRDAFPRLCPVPVVLWLLPSAETLFAKEAPDLWHWRSGTFRFEGPAGRRNRLAVEQIQMPLLKSQSLPDPEKKDRASLLNDLLFELQNASDRETRGNKARRAALLLELSLAYLAVSNLEASIHRSQEAANLYHEIDDQNGQASALNSLGSAYVEMSQFKKALGYQKMTLAIVRELGNRRGEGTVLGNLGTAYAGMGQLKKAVEYQEQSLAIAREIGDRNIEDIALNNLGASYARVGQLEKAVECHEQSLAIAREIGDRRGEVVILSNLGLFYADMGQLEKALGYHEQSLAIARDIGDRRGEGIALGGLGLVYAGLGQSEKAVERLVDAHRIGQEIQSSQIIDVTSKALKQWAARTPG